jgi:hypothetical protein
MSSNDGVGEILKVWVVFAAGTGSIKGVVDGPARFAADLRDGPADKIEQHAAVRVRTADGVGIALLGLVQRADVEAMVTSARAPYGSGFCDCGDIVDPVLHLELDGRLCCRSCYYVAEPDDQGILAAVRDGARRRGLSDDAVTAAVAEALTLECGLSRDRATTAAQAYLRKK